MKQLTENWFVSGLIDPEYKRYVLLAYLQEIEREFAALRLYPPYADLTRHYQNLISFRNEKLRMDNTFPKIIDKEAFQAFSLRLIPTLETEGIMKEVEEIVEYSIPALEAKLNEGKEIYRHIDRQIVIEPIGVLPLYRLEGYLLITTAGVRVVKAFQYKIRFYENVGVNDFGISLEEKMEFTHSLSCSYEQMKMQLYRLHTDLPVPATYLISTEMTVPESPTLIPVVKRKFLNYMK
ncbi:MAG: hypothetical protein K1X92_18815 [Bacteroidia bacterium]|nr:hypothetical protein [Bacteroidia bacterium]